MGLAILDHRLLHDLANVLRRERGLRHARERGELVDHRLDVPDLADDRVRQLVEGLAILVNDAAILAANALGRKLDRRQRILDLVGNAAGDIAPGGRALRGNELGDVVERHDTALVAALGLRLLLGHLDGKDALLIADHHGDLAVRTPLAVRLLGRLRAVRSKGWDRLGDRTAKKVVGLDAEKTFGGRVGNTDYSRRIETDHARADAREHGLHEAAALIESTALTMKLARHQVEVVREAPQIAFAAIERQLHAQVAGGDLLRGADQATDRRHELARKPEAHPDRRQDAGQRQHEVHEAVHELETAARLQQPLVLGDASLRARKMPDDARIYAAGNIEIVARIACELGNGGNAIAVSRQQQRDVTGLGLRDDIRSWRLVGDATVHGRREDHVPLGIDHGDERQVAQARLSQHEIAPGLIITGIHRAGRGRIVEVLRHVDDVGPNDLTMLGDVGVGDIQRVGDDRPRARGKPVVQRAREGGRRSKCQQQRRQRRDQREQQDDPDVHPRAREPRAPGAPQAISLSADHGQHGDDQHHVDHQHQQHDVIARGDGRQPGQDKVGRETRDEREDDDREAKPEGARARSRQTRFGYAGKQRTSVGCVLCAHTHFTSGRRRGSS